MSAPGRIVYKDRKETKLLILHDSHTPPDHTAIEDVPRWETLAEAGSKRMGLLSIGYHYIIERDGEVVQCQNREKIGAHTPGRNMDSIGICLVGGRSEVPLGPFEDFQHVHHAYYPDDNFTPEQRLALLGLLNELLVAYPQALVKGHSEVQHYRNRKLPKCPFLDMDLLREDVELYAQGIVL